MRAYVEMDNAPSRVDMAMVNVNRMARSLDRKHNQILDLIHPTTFWGKARRLVARGPLRQVLIEDPLETLSTELRITANDLGDDVGLILTEGGVVIERAKEVDMMIVQATANPSDRDLLLRLKQTVRVRADEEVGLRLDPKAEEAFQRELTPNTPAEEEEERRRILDEAKIHRDVAIPVVATLEAFTPRAVFALDKLMGIYALVAEYRQAMQIASSTARHLRRSSELGIVTLNVMELKMKHTLAVAELTEITERIYEEAVSTYPRRMASVTTQAKRLMPPTT